MGDSLRPCGVELHYETPSNLFLMVVGGRPGVLRGIVGSRLLLRMPGGFISAPCGHNATKREVSHISPPPLSSIHLGNCIKKT